MAVHDVDLNALCSSSFGLTDLFTQTSEIS
jgi:hypothetical protein